jgi:uncharacterized protein YukE
MSYTGMDIPAIQQLGRELSAAANEIQHLVSKLTPQITGAPWAGPDRERFVNDWTGQHVGQLNQVIRALEDASHAALANAQQQEQASGS